MDRRVEDSSSTNEHCVDAPTIQLVQSTRRGLKEPVDNALVCWVYLPSTLLQKIY